MNAKLADRLYHLLPELYRWRDESHNRTLQAFLSVIQQELAALEVDIEAMYDNWFIQTCDDWVVPYLADLLGVRNTAHSEHMPFTQRRRVANTLAYRRRKGTIAVLEQVAWDVTNWHVSAREGYQLVAATRHLHRPSAAVRSLIDVRRDVAEAGVDDPLSHTLHTVDVRSPVTQDDEPPADASDDAQGVNRSLPAHYGMENVGLYFWRLRAYTMLRSPACPVQGGAGAPGNHLYTFGPDGRSLPLFNRPQSFRAITQRAERVNLPAPLTRRALDADLRTYRAAHLSGDAASRSPASVLPRTSNYYGPGRALNIVVKDHDGKELMLAPWQIMSGDLSRPQTVEQSDATLMAVVDPELGRLALYGDAPAGADGVTRVVVDYTYAFSSDIGGGPYARRFRLNPAEGPLCEINVVAGCADRSMDGDLANGVLTASSLVYALGLWTTYCERAAAQDDVKPRGLIRILDNGVYPLTDAASQTRQGAVSAIWLPEGGELAIVADNGVQPTIGADAGDPVEIVFENPRQRLVSLRAAAVAFMGGEAAPERVVDRALYLGGLRLMSVLTFDEGNTAINTLDVTIEDCRLLGGLQALSATNARALHLSISRSICGPLHLSSEIAGLFVGDSIVDVNLRPAVALRQFAIDCSHHTGSTPFKPAIVLARSTIFGPVRLAALTRADAVLFAATIEVQERQAGLVHFCYLPAGSQTPRCQECLHEEAGNDRCEHCQEAVGRPVFTSRRYGQPGYAQLAAQTPALFRTITGDGGEIGVFHDLYQLQREINLRDVLERYLPLGFRAGVYFVT